MYTIKKLLATCFSFAALSCGAAPTSPIGSSGVIPQYPVIFVHGIASDAATFKPMIGAIDDKNGTYTGGRLLAWAQRSGSLSCSWRGTWDNSETWKPVSSALVPANKKIFAIDFSDSNDLTFVAQARELKTVIDCVKALTGSPTVVLVAHSMGGIASRYYMQNLTVEYGGDVNKLVTINTPHSGALPELYGCLLPGFNLLSGLSELRNHLWCGHTAVGELAPGSFSIRQMNRLAATTNPLPAANYTAIRARNASPTPSVNFSGNDGIVPFDSQSLRSAIAPAVIPDVANKQFDDWIFDTHLAHTYVLESDRAIQQIRLEVAPSIVPRPWALTGSYYGLTTSSVTLKGSASSAGFSNSDVAVEWGNSTSLGNISKQSASAVEGSVSYAFPLTNLSPGSKIYYRFFIRAGVSPFTVYQGKVESVTLPVVGLNYLQSPPGLTPATGSSGLPLRAYLSWSSVPNATSYRVMIAESQASLPTSPSTETCPACIANFEPTQSVVTLSSGTLAPNKTYFWKVKGRAPEQLGDWSSTHSFTTTAASNLPAPLLSSPANMAVTPNAQPMLQWSAVSGASSYRVLVAETSSALTALTAYDPLCADCVVNTTTADTFLTPPTSALIAGKSYFWRVKARSAAQYGELSSPIRSFTVTSGACSYALSSSPTLGVVASTGVATVAVSTQSGCAINITNSPPWLAASAPSVADLSGYAAIGLNVQANTNAASRSAALTVSGQTITVLQSGTAPATSYTITVVQGANGTATPGGSTSFGANQQVTLTATPSSGAYLFSGWKESGSFVSFNSTWTFNATQNRTITAEFIASRIAQNVQMNGGDEYARWRVFPGPDAWSKSSDYVSLEPNRTYDLICSDTPYYYANPGKVTWSLGAAYNGPFACNYLPKAGGGALNLPIRSQPRVATDEYNYLAKLSDGRVVVWGLACGGAPGNSYNVYSCNGPNMLAPQIVPGINGAVSVAALSPNGGKLLAQVTSRDWTSWKGYTPTVKLAPSIESSMQDVAVIRGRFAIKNDGTLWTVSQDAVLETVGGITDVVDAAEAGSVRFALRKDGVVVAISDGFTIPIGIDFDDYVNFVVQPRPPLAPLPSINRVVSIAGTSDNMFAVRQDGTLWVWGYSGAGYGGVVRPVGGYPSSYRPLQVPGINNAVSVVASYRSVYVLLSNGNVVAWAGNSAGQLGRGTSGADDGAPTIIPGLTNVTELAAAINGVLAVKSDGSVWSWGANYGNSPGNSTIAAAQSTPVQVSCQKGYSGFLNLNNAASCTANSQFIVNIDKKTAAVSAQVKVNGLTVTLPYSGLFPSGTAVTAEAEYDAGYDAGYWNFVDRTYQNKIISIPTGVDSDIKLNGGSCVGLLATYVTVNFDLNNRAFAAASSGESLSMNTYVSNRSSTCRWKFNSTFAWIRAANGDGYGPGQYQIQVDPNPTNASRTATFYLTDPATFASSAYTITQGASANTTTPDAFAFTSIGGYPTNTQADSSTLISGINAPSPVSVTNGSHSVGCTGTYTAAASTIANGQSLCVRVMSAPAAATTVTLMATVGGVSAPFNVSTAAACNLNVSGSGTTNANDGLLVMRYLLGFRGASLIGGIAPVGAPANYADLVVDRIGSLPLDLDGNGANDALTDGLMYHRLTSGLAGGAVTNGAIGLGASRADWAAIQAFVNSRCGTSF